MLFRNKAVSIKEVDAIKSWDDLTRIIILVNSLIVCEGITGVARYGDKVASDCSINV